MDKDTAQYIVTYYSSLMSEDEKLAWKHHSSILKLENNDNPKTIEIYKKKGWISEESEVLKLLEKGYDNFELETAKKILERYPEQIFLNKCQMCEKLARTPLAKQCRFCGNTWHLK